MLGTMRDSYQTLKLCSGLLALVAITMEKWTMLAGRQADSKPAYQMCFSDGRRRLSRCASRQTSSHDNQETPDTRVVDQARYPMVRWHVKRWAAWTMQDQPMEPVYVSRLRINKDKITHPGSHAVYNSKALARLHKSRQWHRGELLGE